MAYVDGFAGAVPAANKQAYVDLAAQMAVLFKACGAKRTIECWEDDVPEGKATSFPMAVKRETGESIIFSWIEWPSKATRDEGWKKIMADPSMQKPNNVFDTKRIIFGGFDVVLDA
jgi:uncharacterized protein YbaA (DUF1428 family)